MPPCWCPPHCLQLHRRRHRCLVRPGHTIKGTPFEGGAQVLYGGHQGATVASLQDSDPRHVAAYRLAERLAVGGAPARCRARLSRESLIAATRPLAAITLPRTREFPHWTPRPPSAPRTRDRGRPALPGRLGRRQGGRVGHTVTFACGSGPGPAARTLVAPLKRDKLFFRA